MYEAGWVEAHGTTRTLVAVGDIALMRHMQMDKPGGTCVSGGTFPPVLLAGVFLLQAARAGGAMRCRLVPSCLRNHA